MIHEEICTYEVCKLAKEKGFPLQKVIKQDGRAFFYELPQSHPEWANCDAWYIPTQGLLQRWLREERGIVIEVMCLPTTRTSSKYEYKRHLYWGSDGHYMESEYGDEIFDTYELALEDALEYALGNLV